MYGTNTHTFFKLLQQAAIWRLAAQSHWKLQEKAKEGLPTRTIMRLGAQKPIADLKHQSRWKLAIQKPWKLATQSWWKLTVQANQSLYNTKPFKAYKEHKAHQSLHRSYEIVICFHAAGLHTFASKNRIANNSAWLVISKASGMWPALQQHLCMQHQLSCMLVWWTFSACQSNNC